MKELLEHILEGIIGKKNFEVEEESLDSQITFNIKLDPEHAGLVIGKGGRTIKAIRNILRVKATLEKKMVSVMVSDK